MGAFIRKALGTYRRPATYARPPLLGSIRLGARGDGADVTWNADVDGPILAVHAESERHHRHAVAAVASWAMQAYMAGSAISTITAESPLWGDEPTAGVAASGEIRRDGSMDAVGRDLFAGCLQYAERGDGGGMLIIDGVDMLASASPEFGGDWETVCRHAAESGLRVVVLGRDISWVIENHHEALAAVVISASCADDPHAARIASPYGGGRFRTSTSRRLPPAEWRIDEG